MDIVEDLLVTARFDSGQVTLTVAPTDVASEVKAVLEAQDTEKQLESMILPIQVEADPLRLRQIIRNLITNALRHGGDRIAVRSFSKDGLGYIEVADDGAGFDATDAENIFAPYGRATQTDLSTGSIGLGLTVSRQLAQLMGGELNVVREDDWTTFRLSLPLTDQSTSDPVNSPH